MKIKTSELTGAALDWAVAKCEGYASGCGGVVPYSTDWSQAGPIFERKKLSFCYNDFGAAPDKGDEYIGFIWDGKQHVDLGRGPTPLIAAMRCHVTHELGDEVEVPDELIGEQV